jgi:hypothetical protein
MSAIVPPPRPSQIPLASGTPVRFTLAQLGVVAFGVFLVGMSAGSIMDRFEYVEKTLAQHAAVIERVVKTLDRIEQKVAAND